MSSTALRHEPYAPSLCHLTLRSGTIRVGQVGAGPPLLLINGIGASIEMWEPLAARLARNRHVIMFDAPGTGSSSTPGYPMPMAALARLVAGMLDALDLNRVDILGYSWGGALAQQFAYKNSRRVRRLVLVSTSPGIGGQPPSPAVSAIMLSPARYFSKDFLAHHAPRIYGGDARASLRNARLKSWLVQPPTLRGYAYQALAIGYWTSLPYLRRIVARTLVVQGDDDPLIPMRNGRLLTARIPHAKLTVIPGAGHLWLIEHADDATDLINDFLD